MDQNKHDYKATEEIWWIIQVVAIITGFAYIAFAAVLAIEAFVPDEIINQVMFFWLED